MKGLPSLPETVVAILNILNNPDSSAHELSDALKQDQSIIPSARLSPSLGIRPSKILSWPHRSSIPLTRRPLEKHWTEKNSGGMPSDAGPLLKPSKLNLVWEMTKRRFWPDCCMISAKSFLTPFSMMNTLGLLNSLMRKICCWLRLKRRF